MNLLKKVWATLTSSQQRPDPNAANSDLRDEATKNINRQGESEAREQERMEEAQESQEPPSPVGPSDSAEEA